MKAGIRKQSPRGAATIEFVLVAPLFLLLMLGAIDWGWYFVLRETVVNATREGARAASVQENPDAEYQDAAVAAVRNYLSQVNVAAVPVQDPVVQRIAVTVPGVATPVSAVSVQLVGYPSNAISGLAWTLVPATIDAETLMRFEVQPPPP